MSDYEDLDMIEVPDSPDEPEIQLVDELPEDPIVGDDPEDQEPEPKPEPRPEKKPEDIEYSNAVQKRINAAVRKQREAEERAAAAEARAELLEQGWTNNHTTSMDQREKELRERRDQAIEDGDIRLTTQLSDELYDVRQSKAKPPAADIPTPKVKPVPDEAGDIHPAAEAWLERNSWYNDPRYAKTATKAEEIEKELRASMALGPDLYAELDRRLADKPGNPPAGPDPEEQPNHIAPPSRGGEPPRRPKPGKLTKQHIQSMELVGLDPEILEHRVAFLKRLR